ncbi:MAG: hypothetical protein CL431_08995 [Acidimicrobiaceae bacterium]|jgi:uncharacterized membrane protein|nr:hypothetical protein [Acidimicrobiaceae bacterium]|tara:strand:- start:35746 stop:37272 length:1527 start_codon:yes stop_codon:yes gene_type:complete
MSISWRKRLEYRLLRWQARFESSLFDKIFPWVAGAIVWTIFILLALAKSRELSQTADLASVMQSVWLIGEGYTPESSLLGQNYLASQGGFLIYPIAVLTSIFPTAITLIVIQSAALSFAIVPIWRLSRNVGDLRAGTSMVIIAIYGSYSAIHSLNLSGFRLETFAIPAIMSLTLCAYSDKKYKYWFMATLALLSRADLGLLIAGFGGLWLLEGKKRLGYQSIAFGLSWSIISILGIQPLYNGGAYPHMDAFAQYGTGNPFAVIWGIIINPLTFMNELFSEANFQVGVALLAPLLFLPMVATRYLVPALPLFALYLTADVPTDELAESGQRVPVIVCMFIALVFALQKTGRVIVQRVNVDRTVIGALLITASVFFISNSVASPYEDPWDWGKREPVDQARLEVAELMPDDAVVRAAPKLLPLLTERVALWEFEIPDNYDDQLAKDAVRNVEWFIFDRTDVPVAWTGVDILDFQSDLKVSERFVQVFNKSGIEVYATPQAAETARLKTIE